MGEIDAMLKMYSARGRIPFSMPGHKQRRGGELCLYDVTELPDTDCLYRRGGAAGRANRLLARTYSCDESLIMVNGSTGGIFTMLAAVCKRGDSLLVSRICHKSVINACIALGIEPIFFEHKLYERYSIYGEAEVDDIKKKLAENNVSAVLVTTPNYFGIVSDMKRIRAAAGEIPLLADEAHGAHFFAGEYLPENAVKYCDITVQSAHKTLNGLNQSAFLHINSGRVLTERVREVSEFFQTSSPSYPIAASAEKAVEEVLKNPSEWKKTYNSCAELTEYLKKNTELLIPSAEDGFYDRDMTRLVLNFSKYGITGHEAGEILRKKYNIDIEMSDTENLILIATPSNTEADFEALKNALTDICKKIEISDKKRVRSVIPKLANPEISPSEAFYSECEYVGTEKCAGEISAAVVTVYPPGVPVCVPGVRITREIVEYLQNCGGEITGMCGGRIKVVKRGETDGRE